MEFTENEGLIRDVASGIPGVVFQFYVNAEGCTGLSYVSDQSEKIIGLKPDIGQYFEHFVSLVLPECRDEFLLSVKKAINELSEWRYEGKLKKPKGEIIWFGGHSVRVRKKNGIIFNGIIQDITERKETERSLWEEREIFTTGPVVIFTWRNVPGWPVDYISFDAFGYSRAEFLCGAIVYDDILHPDDRQRVRDELLRYSTGQASRFVHQPYRIIQKDGSVIWLEDHTTIVRDMNGTITHYVGYVIDITEKQEALLRLKESERRFRAIADHTYNWENWVGPDKKTLWTNPAVVRLTGYTREEYLAMPDVPLHLIDEEDRPKINRARDAVLKGETPNDIEFRMHCKDGSLKWEAVSYQPIYDDDGKNLGYRTSVRDITEHKAAQERLIKSEARFRSYFELPLIGRAVTSSDKSWIEVNDHLCDMLGYSREELTHMTWVELTHPDDIAADIEKFDRLLAGQVSSYSMDKRFLRKDGTTVWTSLTVGCVRNRDGSVDYVVCVIQNITDRKAMEAELKVHHYHLSKLVDERTRDLEREMNRRREKEEQYLALIESVKEWIWEINADHAITFVSPRIFEILGYTPRELLGRNPHDVVAQEEVEKLKPLFIDSIQRRESFTSVETKCIHKDGRTVLVEINGRPFFDKNDNFLGFRGSANDITERKKFLDLLQEHEETLKYKSDVLKETNTALRVLLKQRENDRKELENTFISNIKALVLPHLENVQKRHLDQTAHSCLDIALTNLNQIMSPFVNRVDRLDFTPKEIQVASLIRDGRSTKDIADIMGVVPSAINSHRDNIRQKLGLRNKRVNLRSYLLSLNK